MAGLPDKVHIGPFTYNINYEWPEEEAERKRAWGLIHKLTFDIDIMEGMAPKRQVEVTMHEIFHGMWDAAGLGEPVDEETAVSALAIQMIQVMKNNPELIRAMLRELQK